MVKNKRGRPRSPSSSTRASSSPPTPGTAWAATYETDANLDEIVELAKQLQSETNIKPLWGTAQLFCSHVTCMELLLGSIVKDEGMHYLHVTTDTENEAPQVAPDIPPDQQIRKAIELLARSKIHFMLQDNHICYKITNYAYNYA